MDNTTARRIEQFAAFITENSSNIVGQNYQDAWIMFETNMKRDGYFVEFGATDGVTISNTVTLEKNLNWKGVLAEPNPVYHNVLFNNRNCDISRKCVWKTSNEKIDFILTEASDLATIKGFGLQDEHAPARLSSTNIISVDTISLYDLLKSVSAPRNIDYLSIDTEGSEYEILYAFLKDSKMEDYIIDHITVEHNYVKDIRDKIHTLLVANGYERKFAELSRWDDFYKRVI